MIPIPTAILALSVAILLLSGCAALGGSISQTQNDGEETSSGERTPANDEPTMSRANKDTKSSGGSSETAGAEVRVGGGAVVVRSGDVEVTTGADGTVTRDGEVVAEPGGGPGDSGEATLRLTGDEGTNFTGLCEVGGEKTNLDGELPARLDFDLDSEGLACEIGKEGPGLLRVALSAGDNEIIRETNAEDAKIELVYRDGNVVASTSSSSGSSSSSQSSTSSVSSSQSVVQQSSQSSNTQSQSSSSSSQSVSVTN
jgi:hypothetical protein